MILVLLSEVSILDLVPALEKPAEVARKEKLLRDLGPCSCGTNFDLNSMTFFERCSMCEANGEGPLFKCSLSKHQKECPHKCRFKDKNVL